MEGHDSTNPVLSALHSAEQEDQHRHVADFTDEVLKLDTLDPSAKQLAHNITAELDWDLQDEVEEHVSFFPLVPSLKPEPTQSNGYSDGSAVNNNVPMCAVGSAAVIHLDECEEPEKLLGNYATRVDANSDQQVMVNLSGDNVGSTTCGATTSNHCPSWLLRVRFPVIQEHRFVLTSGRLLPHALMSNNCHDARGLPELAFNGINCLEFHAG